MAVYIEFNKHGYPASYNFSNALQGFQEMGFEILPFSKADELVNSTPEDIVVGYVGTVRQRLTAFGITTPEIDYPDELTKYLGRRIWFDTLRHINNSPELWPVFVKPVEDKKFTGVLVRSVQDLIGCGGDEGGNFPALCSEPVNFVAEWRCFVRYGRILDIRRYKGNWKSVPDYNVMEQAVAEFKSAPKGYAIDFGYTDDGRTLLVEVNDGYALGCYGLFYLDYAKLLSARWAELTGTKDECDF